jgi:uncharacterized membrane protein YbaN (DUF454 family)
VQYRKVWRQLPSALRKAIVLVIGSTLIAIGGVLIVLPGPFTLPFVIAGLFILAAEFTWARSLLNKAQESAKRADPRKLKFRRKKNI